MYVKAKTSEHLRMELIGIMVGLAVYLDIDSFPTKYLIDFWCKIGNPGVIMLLF